MTESGDAAVGVPDPGNVLRGLALNPLDVTAPSDPTVQSRSSGGVRTW